MEVDNTGQGVDNVVYKLLKSRGLQNCYCKGLYGNSFHQVRDSLLGQQGPGKKKKSREIGVL